MRRVSEPAPSPTRAHITLNSSRSFCPCSPKGAPDAQPLAVALADALSVGKDGEHRAQAKATAPLSDQCQVKINQKVNLVA